MDPKVLRERLEQKPFRAVTIRMEDGQRIRVPRREWVMLTPNGTTLVVFTGRKVFGDEEMKLLHVPWIQELSSNGGHGRGKSRKGGR